jgi:hypothetical protein
LIEIPNEIRAPVLSIDYTNKDYEAFRSMLIKELSERLPDYTDTSQTDAGIVILELLARGLDILSFYQDVIANEAFFITAKDRENAVKWAAGLGYVPKNKSAARYKQVFVLSYLQDTDILIPAGTKVRTKETPLEKSIMYETERDFIIPQGFRGNEKNEDGEYIYTVNISQGITVRNDLLGTSSGQPNQEFKLSYKSVLADTIRILIDEGAGFEEWAHVKNFIDSRADDKHYIVTINGVDDAIVTFGNNVSGKIPVPFTNGIYANYRVGGIAGNVPPMAINEMQDNIAVISETFNPDKPFEYGLERESLEEIKVNAPAYLRTLWRAVHIDDHSALLLINYNQIKFAKALQNAIDRNAADIWILLKSNEPLSEGFIRKLYDFFEERKMVGNYVLIHDAEFHEVDLTCSLIIKGDYYREDVEKETEDYLRSFFALGQIDFNTQIPLTNVETETLHAVPGLRSLRITSPAIDMIIPEPYEIVTLSDITIQSIGGQEKPAIQGASHV